MLVYRKINGLKIDVELTSEELQKAYYEQEVLFIKQECQERIYEVYSDKIKAGIVSFDDLLEESIKLYKKYQAYDEEHSSNLSSAVMNAYRNVEQKKNYL